MLSIMSVENMSRLAVLVTMVQFLNEEPNDYLSKSDNCTGAFREVVLDKKLLKSLPHHAWSRYWVFGKFQRYAAQIYPNAFEYDYFIARTRLAAIDHNYHLFRLYAFTKDGRMVHHRKFSKRTGTYSICPVKVQKTYSYVQKLTRAILIRRRNSTLPGDTPAVLPAHHPKLTSQTIAIGNLPPLTKILIKDKVSRK